MKKISNAFLDLLFPPKCVFCHRLLMDGVQGICEKCQETLPWTQGLEAEQKVKFVALCAAPLYYCDSVRDAILRYKFSGRKDYAKTFGTLLAQCVSDHLSGEFDLISWVPLSKKSYRKRGYDQARLLARAMARVLGQSALPTLRKTQATAAQSTLQDPAARRANVLGVYEVVNPAWVKGRAVLLVDDVLTTGATASECARMLETAGAASVCCVTLARKAENAK